MSKEMPNVNPVITTFEQGGIGIVIIAWSMPVEISKEESQEYLFQCKLRDGIIIPQTDAPIGRERESWHF